MKTFNKSSPTSSPLSNSRCSTSPISPRQLDSTTDVSLSSPLSTTCTNNNINNNTTTNLVDTHAFRPSIPPKQFVESETTTSVYRQLHSHRPSTTIGVASSLTSASCTGIPRHPRRLWAISDTQLRSRPLTYPPITANMSTVVSQSTATPSVVAVRIAEALKRWPTAVEYDEDACVATAMTSDRCSLTISLWRISTATSTSSTASTVDVLVECTRVRGSSVTFGHLCQTILNAAQSMASGDDTRTAYQMGVLEMGERWEQLTTINTRSHADAPSIARALEHIDSLLLKDRLEAQLLGLERLVGLVDVATSGIATAVVVARTIVMNPTNFGYLWSLIVDKLIHNNIDKSDGSTVTPTTKSSSSARNYDEITASTVSSSKEDEDGLLRSMALRALANALTVLQLHDPESTLESYSLSTAIPELIPVLLDDITSGPSRPPSVTRLASPHEAVYAIRCLKIVGLDQQEYKEEALEALDRARVIGQATNIVLEREARECYLKLTEQDRSC